MELVRQFSNEMNSILDGKLPVSRAKMASITKLGLKATKYYKHVVMTVEKFVSKCAPEYKVPGLYVIDSIVRQSRHQCGADKDNFGPRFSKSFEKTFLNLFLCPPDDKSKIIRVLNLWQKNEVFPPEVIQPLLALAPSPVLSPGPSQSLGEIAPPTLPTDLSQAVTGGGQVTLDLDSANVIIQQQQSQIQALLQQQQQLQSQASTLLGPALQNLLSQASDTASIAAIVKQTQELQQCQELAAQQQMATNGAPPAAQMSNKGPHLGREPHTEFNTALLDDFDYSDDEDDVERRLDQQGKRLRGQEARVDDNGPGDTTDHLLEELQEQFRLQESMKAEPPLPQNNPHNQMLPPMPQHPPQRVDLQPPMAPPLFPPPDVPHPPPMNMPLPPRPPLPSVDYNHGGHPPPPNPPHYPPPHHSPSHPSHYPPPHHSPPHSAHYPPPHHSPPSPPHRGHNRNRFRSPPNSHSKRSRRRSPSPHRRHSGPWRDRDWERRSPRQRSPWRRSRSPPRRDRNNSHSKTPPLRSPRRRSQRSPDERSRPRKESLSQKERHVTVLTTTIWMGHLAKTVSKEQIIQACGEYGQVQSVDVVTARGCAYVVMETRPDAMKVLNALKDLKLNASTCKLAWAPGRGVKGASYRNYWSLDDGMSVIPWELVQSQSDLDKFMDGGWIEPTTCPPGMKPTEPVKVQPPLPIAPHPVLPLFPPQGLPPPLGPPNSIGAPQPMFPPPQVMGGPCVPLMPPNNAHLPPHPSKDNEAGNNVDMQIDSPPVVNSEL